MTLKNKVLTSILSVIKKEDKTMKHTIKMSRRLAERLLRKVGTNFITTTDEVLETITEVETSRDLVDDWKVKEIYYKGAYMTVADKED